MGLVVQKFGGTSVANAERIKEAARKAIRCQSLGNQVLVVVSARGDTTDDLIAMAHEISEHPPEREMDMLLATGEQISIALLAMAIHAQGAKALSFTGPQIGIVTDSTHTKARIKSINTQKIVDAFEKNNIVIVAGFQGMDELYDITTLGRGGSDTTAVALAAAMKNVLEGPVECEIYTDVDGVYTTDPRLIPEAHKIDMISYDEMLELASMGAGVMHSRSIEFAKKFDVPLMVRNSFSDALGTWIIPEAEWMTEVPVCGVALARDEARIVLEGVPDEPGVSHRIFAAVAHAEIAIDMIVQSVGSAGKATLGFTVLRNDLPATLSVLSPVASELGATVRGVEDISKVSVVGAGMRFVTGVAERMFAALAAESVNIKMISTSDIKISVLVEKAEGLKALKAVHQAFKLQDDRQGAGLPVEKTNAVSTFRKRRNVNGDESRNVTLAASRLTSMEDILVSGVQMNADRCRITIHQLPDRPGNCSRIFNAIASQGIMVDTIVQNLTAPGYAELTFTLHQNDLEHAVRATETVVHAISPDCRVVGDENITELFVYGVGMRTHTGVAKKMFHALAHRKINIRMINTSEVCIGVVVERRCGEEALQSLRQEFALSD